jgi:hypothetical protein
MEKSIRKNIPESDNVKNYLKSVGGKFTRFDKAKKREYLSLFVKTKYDCLHHETDSLLQQAKRSLSALTNLNLKIF